ncbi:MAG: hypothetical protein GX488_01510, partial [Clostridiales bacterium]|nr:hypothetical protein [Clostridiales bacterium]
ESVTYKTSVLSAIPEQQSKEDITTEAALSGLCSEEAEYIKVRMEDVIKTSKLYGIDCIGLSDRIVIQHPYKWKKIEKQWTEIYPQLKINVDVTCKISGSYDISLPN